MATVIIPTEDRVFYSADVVLETKVYTFDFYWNSRERTQTISISDGDGIICRVKPVVGVDLLEPYRYNERCPPGVLYAITATTEKDTSPPDLGDMLIGGRIALKYLEST